MPSSPAAPQPSREPIRPPTPVGEVPVGQLFLSSEQSWFSANKYIIGSLALVAVVIAIIAMVR
jgi:hypothetical protein